jgi:hypothetical protein
MLGIFEPSERKLTRDFDYTSASAPVYQSCHKLAMGNKEYIF